MNKFKKIYLIFILCILTLPVFTQSRFHKSINENIDEIGLFTGYNFNGWLNSKSIHTIELGVKKSSNIGWRRHDCTAIYFANEFLFTDDKFMIGPKVGAYFSYNMLTFGIESNYYTDFSGQSVRLSPYFGLGNNTARLTINFPINLYKNNFDYINPVTIHFSYQFLIIWEKSITDHILEL